MLFARHAKYYTTDRILSTVGSDKRGIRNLDKGPTHRYADNITIVYKGTECDSMNWNQLAENRLQER